eukprot:TRINITY_DN18734_c0_g1_i1.p1 TRINITY_DN18734_c0_g1~~TRINITY_DN18734_c0_g1_i1.p1  ORF type:complete len:222 (-),score=36.03 TRINITY_DN18734_c0_g1_i1:62-727(-)
MRELATRAAIAVHLALAAGLSTAQNVSIWLCPPEDHPEHARLKELNQQLSTKFSAPPFQAHLTLLGDIEISADQTLEDVKAKVKQLAASLPPFEVRTAAGSLTSKDVWNHNVLLVVPEEVGVIQAHLDAVLAFKGTEHATHTHFPLPTGRPHVSLLYGEHSKKDREAAVAWTRENHAWADSSIVYPVKELQLWETSGGLAGVPHWYKIDSYALTGHPPQEL